VTNTIPEHEAVACLKVLVALMKADGKIAPSERASLEGAIAGFELGGAISVDSLLDAEIDLDAELARITTPDARAQTYRSASFMVNADGRKVPAEVAMLERIAAATDVSSGDRASIDRVFTTQPKSKVGALVDSLGSLFRRRA
jgi:uncharacterized tellurite resistance protein B-like protein